MPCASCTDSAGQVHHANPMSAREVHGPKPHCPKCGQVDEMGVWDTDHPSGIRWFCLRCHHVWAADECAELVRAERIISGDSVFRDGHWSHVVVSETSASRWVLGVLSAITDATAYVTLDRSDLVVVRRG